MKPLGPFFSQFLVEKPFLIIFYLIVVFILPGEPRFLSSS